MLVSLFRIRWQHQSHNSASCSYKINLDVHLPQMVEMNTPQLMDVVDDELLYNEMRKRR